MSENEKKKNHTKSGLAKIAAAALGIRSIVFSIMSGGKKDK